MKISILVFVALLAFCSVTGKKLGEECSGDQECRDSNPEGVCRVRKGSVNRECNCPEGRRLGTIEQDKSTCEDILQSSCDNDSECEEVEGASCETNICTCKSGRLPNENKCQKFNGGPCINSVQCKSFLGDQAECKEANCICNENFHIISNQCIQTRHLNQECKISEECQQKIGVDNVLRCEGGKCVCLDGYRENGDECNSASSLIGLSFASIICIIMFTRL